MLDGMAFWFMRLPRSVARWRCVVPLSLALRFFRSGTSSVAEASLSLRSPAALFRDSAAFLAVPWGAEGNGFTVTFLRTGSPPADDDALAGSFGFEGKSSHMAMKEASALES